MGDATAVTVNMYQIVSILLGGGVFLTLLRLSFLLGQYSQRVMVVEAAMERMGKAIEDLTHEINELRRGHRIAIRE